MELSQTSLEPETARRTVEQLDICHTNILLQCIYSRGQLDKRKVGILFSGTEYFRIKYHNSDQPLIFEYKALLYKCKFNERP